MRRDRVDGGEVRWNVLKVCDLRKGYIRMYTEI